jgi:hypothetical protein
MKQPLRLIKVKRRSPFSVLYAGGLQGKSIRNATSFMAHIKLTITGVNKAKMSAAG